MIEAFESGVPMTDAHGIGSEIAQTQAAIESMRAAWAGLVAGDVEPAPQMGGVPDEPVAAAGGSEPMRGGGSDDGQLGAWLLLAALRFEQRASDGFRGPGLPERTPVRDVELPDLAARLQAPVARHGDALDGIDGRVRAVGGAWDFSPQVPAAAMVPEWRGTEPGRDGAALGQLPPGGGVTIDDVAAILARLVPAFAGGDGEQGSSGFDSAPSLLGRADHVGAMGLVSGGAVALDAGGAGAMASLAAGAIAGVQDGVGGMLAGTVAGGEPPVPAVLGAGTSPADTIAAAAAFEHGPIGSARELLPLPASIAGRPDAPGGIAVPSSGGGGALAEYEAPVPWRAMVPPADGDGQSDSDRPVRSAHAGHDERMVPGEAGPAPFVVHTEVHLDGRVLARAVTERIVAGMNGPLAGAGGFDPRRSYTPVEG